MAIFGKNSKKETFEELKERLVKKAVISGDSLQEVREEIIAMVGAAVDSYLEEAAAYRERIDKELDARRERLTALEAQKAQAEAAFREAEGKFGNALASGTEEEKKAAEADVDARAKDIKDIEWKIGLFRAASFEIHVGNLRTLELKDAEIKNVISQCNELSDAVSDAVTAHLNDFREKQHKRFPFYPANLAGTGEVLGLLSFDEDLELDELRKFNRPDLKISDVM